MNQQQNPNENFPRDVLKLYVTYGSDREYMLVHGRKPLMIYDLKMELNRLFKIPLDKQCIVFKGYYLHEYLDDAPLEAFGLENNSPISVWFKGENDPMKQEYRLPRPPSPNNTQQPMYSPRDIANLSSRWCVLYVVSIYYILIPYILSFLLISFFLTFCFYTFKNKKSPSPFLIGSQMKNQQKY